MHLECACRDHVGEEPTCGSMRASLDRHSKLSRDDIACSVIQMINLLGRRCSF